MIKETGTVVKCDETYAWVETSIKSTCNTCAAKTNCGTSAIASAVAGKTLVNKVVNQLEAEVGDTVEIGVPEETLLSGSFYLYILPLFTAIAAALACQFWLSRFVEVGEGLVILSTFLGGALGFYFSRIKLAKEQESSLLPILLKVLPANLDIKNLS